jgi:hypothetical protein
MYKIFKVSYKLFGSLAHVDEVPIYTRYVPVRLTLAEWFIKVLSISPFG